MDRAAKKSSEFGATKCNVKGWEFSLGELVQSSG